MIQKTSIAILGPGAIGGFLATLLSRAGNEVVCIGREKEVDLIAKDGIGLESKLFGNIEARPRALTRLEREPDILFITVKAPYLRESLERIPKNLVSHSVIIPFLNGLGHAEILREYFGPRVAVGMIGAIEVSGETPGRVAHMSPQIPHIELASDQDVSGDRLEGVAKMLQNAGLSAKVLKSEAEVIWRKLVRLNAIAATTAVVRKPVGFVRTDPEWQKTLKSCVEEGSAVAKAEGVVINPQEVMRQIDNLPADLTTSLQRDIAAGHPSEIDAILGGVLERAKRHGISCPAIKKIYGSLVRQKI